MKKYGLLLIVAVALVSIAGVMVEWANRVATSFEVAEFESYKHRDGKMEAEADIARGAPKWKVYGLQRDTDIKGEMMKKSLGIELGWFAGCVVSGAIERYAYDYDSAVWSHLVALYGEPKVYGLLGDKPQKPEDYDKEG
jgi:hypothetical protein